MYTFSLISFQVIIPCSWIFGVVINIPGFVCANYVKAEQACAYVCPEEWIGQFYSSTWCLLVAFLPVCLMTSLYSRVVVTLWFKSAKSDENSSQQLQV